MQTPFAPAVLVLDDDPAILDMLAQALRDEGYRVATGCNGYEGLARLGAARYDLILLDLMMPGMNGWDFRSAQLRDPELSAVPVVIVTASGFSQEAIRTELGAIELVPKPIQPTILLGVIERLTARARASA
jgi:CheY-like chemotaxis protein